MFDFVPEEFYDELFMLANCLFFEHGHELAKAAAMLGGASAETMVASCGHRLRNAGRITPCTWQNLLAIKQLLSLERVSDPESLESVLFFKINPECPEVEMICLLTDMLVTILDAVNAPSGSSDRNILGQIAAA